MRVHSHTHTLEHTNIHTYYAQQALTQTHACAHKPSRIHTKVAPPPHTHTHTHTVYATGTHKHTHTHCTQQGHRSSYDTIQYKAGDTQARNLRKFIYALTTDTTSTHTVIIKNLTENLRKFIVRVSPA